MAYTSPTKNSRQFEYKIPGHHFHLCTGNDGFSKHKMNSKSIESIFAPSASFVGMKRRWLKLLQVDNKLQNILVGTELQSKIKLMSQRILMDISKAKTEKSPDVSTALRGTRTTYQQLESHFLANNDGVIEKYNENQGISAKEKW